MLSLYLFHGFEWTAKGNLEGQLALYIPKLVVVANYLPPEYKKTRIQT